MDRQTLESFGSDKGADSVLGEASSMAAKLEERRDALRDEVFRLKKQSKEIGNHLRTPLATLRSRIAEIESRIRWVEQDMDALNAKKAEFEAEIAALTACADGACRNPKNAPKAEQHEVGVEDRNAQAMAFYEKILRFRLENEIFDEELPPLHVLEDQLRRCTECVYEARSLRLWLCESSEGELDSIKENGERKEALRSYSELMLQYLEAQLKRTKLVLLRLQKAKKKVNDPGVGHRV